jgi:hypothetical protein
MMQSGAAMRQAKICLRVYPGSGPDFEDFVNDFSRLPNAAQTSAVNAMELLRVLGTGALIDFSRSAGLRYPVP